MRTPSRTRAFILAASLCSAGLGFASPAMAGDPWGLEHEKVATFRARVVDLVCAVAGDCPPDCGAGKRQFGLLTDDGKLRAAIKGSVDFAGPPFDLAPYCNRTVFVDGLLVENPKMTMMFVQNIREREDEPWRATEAFRTRWQAANGPSDEWFRNDPEVKRIIAADGVFGISGLKSRSPDVRNPALKATP